MAGRYDVITKAVKALALASLPIAWAGVGTLAYASLYERHAYRLREVSVPVLAPGSSPIRALHLSDFHLLPWQTRKIEWVRELARLQPDLIVNTGDNLGHADTLRELQHMLEPFRGLPGVIVHGSNDYYGPVFKNPLAYVIPSLAKRRRAPKLNAGEMDAMLRREFGWRMLDNRACDIDVAGQRIRWMGLADPHIKRDRLRQMQAQLRELESTEQEPVARIGLVHAPYLKAVDALVHEGCDIVLAGHTHGGQVAIPGYGAIITNCDLPRQYAKGLTPWPPPEAVSNARDIDRERDALEPRSHLHVSAGLGTSVFAPFRLACFPEATLLTLTPREPSDAREHARAYTEAAAESARSHRG